MQPGKPHKRCVRVCEAELRFVPTIGKCTTRGPQAHRTEYVGGKKRQVADLEKSEPMDDVVPVSEKRHVTVSKTTSRVDDGVYR